MASNDIRPTNIYNMDESGFSMSPGDYMFTGDAFMFTGGAYMFTGEKAIQHCCLWECVGGLFTFIY
jgi:hypothetical protein